MSDSPYFEDVNIGDELPSLSKVITTGMLVRYAGASRDFSPLHYDQEWANENNVWGGIIAHGMVKTTFTAQLLTDWAGPSGTVREMKCYYRGPDKPGDTVLIRGKVVNKLEKDGEHLVEVDTEVVGTEERITTPGHAVVVLPSRDYPEERPSLVRILSDEARAKRAGSVLGEQFQAADQIRGQMGVPWTPYMAHINSTWITMFAESTEDFNPLYTDPEYSKNTVHGGVIAPPTFLAALDPSYRRGRASAKTLPNVAPNTAKGGGNGWDEFCWYAPVRPGDTITAYGRWKEVYEKTGRSGQLMFLVREIEYENQRRELVARSQGAVVRIV
jgi:acyl dehydratase